MQNDIARKQNISGRKLFNVPFIGMSCKKCAATYNDVFMKASYDFLNDLINNYIQKSLVVVINNK